MDWLAELGKGNTPIVFVKKTKSRTRCYNKKDYDVKEYKAQYYIKNLEKYTERNRKASEERTVARLQKLSDEETMYKMKVILDN